MISAEATALEFGDSEDVASSPAGHHHHRLALRLLKAVEATPFFQALGDELAERLKLDAAPRTPEQTVHRFAE